MPAKVSNLLERTNHGLTVMVNYDHDNKTCNLEVHDPCGAVYETPIPAGKELDAFWHPAVYVDGILFVPFHNN